MAMRTSRKLLSWGIPISRKLCTATVPVVSKNLTETDVLSDYKPLYRRLSALGAKPGGSVAETMKQWDSEGRKVTVPELMNYVREFRRYKSYKTALELIDWMEASGIQLSSSIHAMRLDLVAKAKGIDQAENYFSNLSEINRNKKTYGALLSCYCLEKKLDKAIALCDTMRKFNISYNTLTYNNLMSLHIKMGNPKKIPSLLQEMKAANVSPDVYTHCLLMHSYAAMNDFDSIMRLVGEIEMDALSPLSWSIYASMASHFITAGLFVKAEVALKKLEKLMNVRNRECYHCLIIMYAGISNLTEVIRVWKFLKNSFTKTTNKSFMVMFQACIKLNEMETLKQCYDEWKCICLSFDIRLPYKVMSAYLRNDMIEEAEYVLDNVFERGYGNDCFSWGTFIGFHLRNNDMDLALKSLRFATSFNQPHQWRPKKELVKEFHMYFEETKDVERAEELCRILKDVNVVDMDVYESLLRTYLAAGRKDSALRLRIEENGFKLSSETEKLLERACLSI